MSSPSARAPRPRKAILDKHPALRKAFGRRLRFGLMFTESRPLRPVMLAVRAGLSSKSLYGSF